MYVDRDEIEEAKRRFPEKWNEQVSKDKQLSNYINGGSREPMTVESDMSFRPALEQAEIRFLQSLEYQIDNFGNHNPNVAF